MNVLKLGAVFFRPPDTYVLQKSQDWF